MGDLLLTDKEATGLVIKDAGAARINPRWAAVGKVCSPRKLVIGALERALHRAWGLHHPAAFREIGDNRFVVKFSSEGDYRHVMKGGPWKFDFNVVLLKKFDGAVRPSDMVFDELELWARVLDLPMDMMNRAYGELIGDWIGKFISVETDDDGMAWGQDLRIRVAVKVDQPLLRGVCLRQSEVDGEGTWFDLKYEKVPHFCFDCGRLVHPGGGYPAEKEEVQQWGEWLRASPRRNQRPPPPIRPSVQSSSYSSRSAGSESRYRGEASVRDVPPRRNLFNDYAYSSSSRTSERGMRSDDQDNTSPAMKQKEPAREQYKKREPLGSKQKKGQAGTYTRRQRRNDVLPKMSGYQEVLRTNQNKKRSSKMVWQPVPVQVVGEETSGSAGKRQRVNSVFDRLDGHEEEGQRSGSVFERLEEPAADPAGQGRRDQ
jgi:hypothetical protein